MEHNIIEYRSTQIINELAREFQDKRPSSMTVHTSLGAPFQGLLKLRTLIDSERRGRIMYGGIFYRLFEMLNSDSVDGLTAQLRNLVFHLEIASKLREAYKSADNRRETSLNNITQEEISALLSQSQMREFTVGENELDVQLLRSLVTDAIMGKESLRYISNAATDQLSDFFEASTLRLQSEVIESLEEVDELSDAAAKIQRVVTGVAQLRITDMILQMYNNPTWLFKVLNDDNFNSPGSSGNMIRADQLKKLATIFKGVITYGTVLPFYVYNYAYNESKKLINVMDDPGITGIDKIEEEIISYDFLNCKADFDRIINFVADWKAGDNEHGTNFTIRFHELVNYYTAIPDLPAIPDMPAFNDVLTRSRDEDLLKSNAVRQITSGMYFSRYDKYPSSELVWGLDTEYYRKVAEILQTLRSESYNLEQKSFLQNVTKEMNAHTLPLVVPMNICGSLKSCSEHSIRGNEIVWNNNNLFATTQASIDASNAETRMLMVDDNVKSMYNQAFLKNFNLGKELRGMLYLSDSFKHAEPAVLSDEQEYFNTSNFVFTENADLEVPLQTAVNNFSMLVSKLTGISGGNQEFAFLSDLMRERLSVLLMNIGTLYHYSSEGSENEIAVNKLDYTKSIHDPTNKSILTDLLAEVRENESAKIDNESVSYGLNSEECHSFNKSQMSSEKLNRFVVMTLSNTDVLIFYPYINLPNIDLSDSEIVAKTIGINRFYYTKGLGSQESVSNNTDVVKKLGKNNFFTIVADNHTNGITAPVSYNDSLPGLVAVSDFAAYHFKRIFTVGYNRLIFKNDNSKLLKVTMPIGEIEFPGVLPNGEKFVSYLNVFTSESAEYRFDNEVANVREKIDKIRNLAKENEANAAKAADDSKGKNLDVKEQEEAAKNIMNEAEENISKPDDPKNTDPVVEKK